MPDPTSLKEFVKTVRTRKRYHSQCTPEKTINVAGINISILSFFFFISSLFIFKQNYLLSNIL